VQREATIDKLYIADNRLLTVEHLFVRTEHGQPRPLDAAERARFLAELATAEAELDPPMPDKPAPLPAETRARPDSVVIAGRSQPLEVTVPAHVAAGTAYPLIVALSPLAATPPPPADAFVVVRVHKALARADEIAAFMRAKYPIDPARIVLPTGPDLARAAYRPPVFHDPRYSGSHTYASSTTGKPPTAE
jgi:hypothetical protein